MSRKHMSPREYAVRSRASSRKLTNAKAASKLRAVAEKLRQRGLRLFGPDKMVEDDYNDLKSIAADIRAGDLAVAYDHARRLETAVREAIPLDVWMYIGGRGLHE